ncbi:MAG: hypothetical protein JRI68_35490, partial [Deltaproteobacteria bacterium]|nr:hypothetical protein [Deltaproteobacteria bacterium]
ALSLTVAALLSSLSLGCDRYDSPPRPSMPDVDEQGTIEDAAADLRLAFHEPIDYATLNVRVIRYQVDGEGRLYDEDEDPSTELEVFFKDADGDLVGGIGDLDATKMLYSIGLFQTMPIGPQLALLIEPGLADEEGNAWAVRQVLKFGVSFGCSDALPTTFPDATHFMQIEVDSPIDTQLQLLADIHVDPETGVFVGQITNADRDPSTDCEPYGLTCDETEVCRTLPTPDCVEPSTRVATTDEYPDFIHNNVPPTGYGVTVRGCVVDKAENVWTFTNDPADVVVQSPPVTVKGLKFNAQFEIDDQGVLRGEGAMSAAELFLGTTPNGEAKGTCFMRAIPEGEVKEGLPPPPYEPEDVPPQ